MSVSSYTIRPLATHAEYLACLELQRQTWGDDFTDLVPPTILKVAQRLGGVATGAFDADDRLVAFVFGMTGVEQGRVVHWSDMLAVRPEVRDQGIGRALKAHQRDRVRALGVEVMYWTYDPLQARNARLNLMVLGAEVVEYVEDMYGASTDSVLHRGIGTDRFVVAWHLEGRPERAWHTDASDAPLLNACAPEESDVEAVLASHPALVRVQIPLDLGEVQRTSLEVAHRWRLSTRAAFTSALAAGYRVDGILRDESSARGYYLLRLPATA